MTPHNRDEVMARLAGRTVVCSVSGGKDSTAMALYLTRELKLPAVRFVFADTGWEHPATYDYIRDVLEPVLRHIDWVGYPGGMEALCFDKGFFPQRQARFCTQELKVKPIQAFVGDLMDAGTDVVVAVGIRAGESAARARLQEWEFNKEYDCDVWRPLISWDEDAVIATHTRHCVHPNPLYLRGASRVGCWPCIFSRKKEIDFLAKSDPATIDKLRSLEARMTERSRANYAARGEDIRFQRTWFQPRGDGAVWDIDTVVLWASTDQGGRQFELFESETEPGCVRWGLCESLQKDGEAA